ncbi:MAG: hypothetical protein N2489_04075 [Clostridia bacterium]|nr:hypothetical protein [Clostridia bacterium]
MRNELKSSLKVFTGYLVSLILFVLFIPSILSFGKDNLGPWIFGYSLVIFILMCNIIFADMKKLGDKERRPEYNLKPYPLKGLVVGFMGFLPFILLQIAYPFIKFNLGPIDIERLKHVALNTLMGPLYWFIKLGNESAWAYAAAASIVPLIAMAGYMAGIWRFEFSLFPKRQPKSK